MRRLISAFLIILIVISLSGCSSTSQEKVWLEAGIDNGVRSEFGILTTSFKVFMDQGVSAKTEKDMAYLSGEISGFSMSPKTEMARVFSNSNIDEKMINDIISPKLREPLDQICTDMSRYLIDLNDNILKKDDIKALDAKKGEMAKLSELVLKFNVGDSSMFINDKYVDEFIKTIFEMKTIMNKGK